MSVRIDALAQRVRDDSYFLASALEEYARSEQLDWEGLADMLGCSPQALGPLALCRRPRAERFREGMREIAARFGIREAALAEVVRRSDALAALRRAPRQQPVGDLSGVYTAARDRRSPRRASREHREEPS